VLGAGRIAASVVLAATLAVNAHAADVPRLPPTANLPPPPTTKWSYSGWYVRGDLGWRLGLIGDVDLPAGASPTDNKLGAGLTTGAGIGLRTSFLRTDLTIDYAFPVNYSGTLVAPADTKAKIQSINLLLNGYLDLGTWYGFTPYVGGGAGGALVKAMDVQSVAPSADNSRWNFAWAGMAGVAWMVSPNVQIDFGYRYLNVGKAQSGGPNEVTFDKIAGHEVRVGLRWNFEDLREFRAN
jgi:opacity protein-like surface antigen